MKDSWALFCVRDIKTVTWSMPIWENIGLRSFKAWRKREWLVVISQSLWSWWTAVGAMATALMRLWFGLASDRWQWIKDRHKTDGQFLNITMFYYRDILQRVSCWVHLALSPDFIFWVLKEQVRHFDFTMNRLFNRTFTSHTTVYQTTFWLF